MKSSLFLLFLSFIALAQPNYYGAKGTNVEVLIDGDTSDAVWKNASWQPIDKFWLPYNNDLTNGFPIEGSQLWQGTADFSGKYKMLWSSKQNKLVILIDIIDDFFRDGYNGGGGYSSYDLPEIFIDEDNSKTKHHLDKTTPFENAESAFAYHLAVKTIVGNSLTTLVSAMDIGGTNISTQLLNYGGHFPKFALKKIGNNHYVYEMTLTVYNDTYPVDYETYTSQLMAGKIMGFALNYCDNDANDGSRDHFISSVTVAGMDNNTAWLNSSVFGILELLPEPNSVSGFDTLAVKENQIVATWNPTVPNFSVTGFYFYCNNILLGSTTGTTYTVSGLASSTFYTLNVVAFNHTAVSNSSEYLTISTKRNTTIGTVVGVDTLFVGNDKIGLTWSKDVYNFTVKGFNIYKDNNWVGSTLGNTFTVLGLSPLTNYTFTIQAYDKNKKKSVVSLPKTITTKSELGTNLEYNFNLKSPNDLFKILPNPGHTYFEIFNPHQIDFEATIVNIYGQIIKTNIKNESTILINTENWANGVYFLHIHTQKAVFIRHFLKI